ncbi:PepSY domain-containing protein [Gramella sp. KN1008]|uniref:PepSY-associated TM helix domain-containing protein n=1 Tax=Gramella sp. KN1008 TaxID=2529298 RepID=UPI00103D1E4B|nr:PepSY-associated TM helix domain-containing protein [Gramella sp. KN1008]TBW27090.1 PepSY domain-containing protein [Gramella sp. KN1008]
MNNRKLLKYHSWFGLIAGLFFILMGISGSILIFHDELDKKIFSEFQNEAFTEEPKLDISTKLVQKKYPGWDTRIKEWDNGQIIYDVRHGQKRRYVFTDPETGMILKDLNANSHFTAWLLKLHYSLHSGITGRISILVAGIVFLLSLITGTILYRKSIFKTLTFQVKIRATNKRNFYSGLHRYVGSWALIFNMVIVLTGIILAYSVAKAGLNPRKEYNGPLIDTSIEAALNGIEKEIPQFQPTYIRLPLEKGAGIIVYGDFKTDFFLFSEFYNQVKIDETKGNILSINRIASADFLTRLNSVVMPLHYAEFGGLPVKILYALVGLTGPFLSITGFILWWRRPKRSKNFRKTAI